jgi:serine/threonine protein phosphatase 1
MHYVLSDIHGNERRFASILDQIRLDENDTLYVLGDVIDRHRGGLRILRRLMSMPNAKLILGNHEYMMLRALGQPVDDNHDNGTAMQHWYRNGGDVTHRHWKFLRKTTRQQILDYLHSLPLSRELQVNGITYRLVHAAPLELWDSNCDKRYLNPTHFAVWRRLDVSDPMPTGLTVIFGHTPTRYYRDVNPMEVFHGADRIGIDCGSGYPESGEAGCCGRLACLRLEDGKVFYSSES